MQAVKIQNYIVEDLLLDLGQFELEEAIEELDSAIENQEHWYADLNRRFIFDLAPNSQDLSSESHHLCAFGAWLDMYGNEKIRQQPIFDKIKHNHKLLHQLASELLTKVVQGEKLDPVEYDALYKLEKSLRHRLHELNSKLREKASNLDGLTGLYNRKEMFTQLARQQEFVDRGVYDVTIALMDVDNFKGLNDTYGHLTGDKILRQLSDYLSSNVRSYDTVYRYGGDEFLILLPNTKLYKAYQILSRLHEKFGQFVIAEDDEKMITVTTSFGVAALKKETDIETSIKAADNYLFEAKKKGKNRLLVSGLH